MIDADKITLGVDGSADNVVTAIDDCSFKIRNARIANLRSASGTTGININPGEDEPLIELQNVTVAISDPEGGETIYLEGSNEVNIYNYYLFVNKEISGENSPPTLLIGTGISGNYKYIVSPYVLD